MKNKGFTLLELMVVISIIGILASISIPSYGDYIMRAQVSEGISLTTDIKKRVAEFYKSRGKFPADNGQAGVPEANKLLGNFVKNIAIVDGSIDITFGQKAHDFISGKKLSLRPIYVPDSPMSPISWVCGYSTAPDGMQAHGIDATTLDDTVLPSSCRSL